MAPEPQDDDDAARTEETQLVAGLVSAMRSHGGHLDPEQIDAALGVTHEGEQGDSADEG